MCNCKSQQGCCSKDCQCGCQSGQQKGCGCQSGSSCSKSGSCSSHSGCDYAGKFLELADQAWMEVLKEKIKDHIKSNAKYMDELARLISEANKEKWHKKMENKQCCSNFEERIKSFFSESCQQKNK